MHAPKVQELNEAMEKVLQGRDTADPEVKAMLLLFQGVMAKGCKRTEEAQSVLTQVIEMEKKLASDSLVLPYAYYEIGELEYRAGNLKAANKLFEKGMGKKGDGHETLANRYAIAMKQLTREMKEKGL